MRIGLLASVSHHLDSFWLEIAEYWRSQGHEVFLGAGDASDKADVEMISGVSRNPSVRSISAPRSVRRWVATHALEIVVTNTATASMIARLSLVSVPVVYFAHGFHWSRGSNLSNHFWKAIEGAAVPLTAAFICLNADDEVWLAERVSPDRILRLQYGVGLEVEKFTYSPPVPGIEFCWIGEFSKRKRPYDAVRTLARLRTLLPEAKLRMLGTGDLRESTISLAGALGVLDAVDFAGFSDSSIHLTETAGLIHTATWEGLPRVALEALAIGRPVFSYPIKGLDTLPNITSSVDESPDSLALEIWSASREGLPAVIPPASSDLDYRASAQSILNFLESVVAN